MALAPVYNLSICGSHRHASTNIVLVSRSAATLARIRAEHSGLDAIRAFIDRTLIDVSDRARRRGCLLVNSVLELEGVETAGQRERRDDQGMRQATFHGGILSDAELLQLSGQDV